MSGRVSPMIPVLTIDPAIMANADDLPRHKVSAQGSSPKPNLSHPLYLDGIPRPLSPKDLPGKYKPAERRVRTVIIALPIAIVTSFVLWNRLIKGEERKILIRPPPGVDGSSAGSATT